LELYEKALERPIELGTTVSFISYPKMRADLDGRCLGLAGYHQRLNAALAIGLCYIWTKKFHQEKVPIDPSVAKLGPIALPIFQLDFALLRGLKECHWPGRAQIVSKDHVVYFVDGAHTPESIDVCKYWFNHSQHR
jgi:folylpolyglutamate synthase